MGSYGIPAGAPGCGVGLEQRRDLDALAFGEKHRPKLVGANFFLSGDPVPIAVSDEFEMREARHIK